MMFEWILVLVIWGAATVIVAHTIDEAVGSAAPLREQSHRCPGGPERAKQFASRVQRRNDDAAQKWAA